MWISEKEQLFLHTAITAIFITEMQRLYCADELNLQIKFRLILVFKGLT
jgi:hypothetical protein